jgi:hypothetical protein
MRKQAQEGLLSRDRLLAGKKGKNFEFIFFFF